MVRSALEYLGFMSPSGTQAPPRVTRTGERHVGPSRPSSDRPTSITPIRTISRPQRHDAGYSTIHTIRPRRYADDAQHIADIFRTGSPVIIDLSQMQDTEVRRLIDFMSGLVEGLEGTIRRVASKVFMLTPAGIQQWDDEMDQDSLSDGFDDLAG